MSTGSQSMLRTNVQPTRWDPRGAGRPRRLPGKKGKVLALCGSLNQNTQLSQVIQHLPDYEFYYTPYYGNWFETLALRLGISEFSIGGAKRRQWCLDWLEERGLDIDLDGRRGGYDLVLSCTDLISQKNLRGIPKVVVQEGITDPEGFGWKLWRRFPFLPRWVAGTAPMGLSNDYEFICVASEGYKQHMVERGAIAERVRVTGIPNFDDCTRYANNDFPFRGYVLACTSDARECLKKDDRPAFLRRAVEIAAGRPLIFKLHPNENHERAIEEIQHYAPTARTYVRGSAEEMVANCDVLITQYSTLVFVGLALDKECYSFWDIERLRRLCPIQNGATSAYSIAQICREVLGETPRQSGHAAGHAGPSESRYAAAG